MKWEKWYNLVYFNQLCYKWMDSRPRILEMVRWKNLHWLSERRAPLGIMGTQLNLSLKPLSTIECCDARGVSGGPPLDPHDADRCCFGIKVIGFDQKCAWLLSVLSGQLHPCRCTVQLCVYSFLFHFSSRFIGVFIISISVFLLAQCTSK